jgi:Domain of unknown function (DU1801)
VLAAAPSPRWLSRSGQADGAGVERPSGCDEPRDGASQHADGEFTNDVDRQPLRQYIRDALPDVEECISYGMPAFKVDGKTVAGFAAFKNHLSHLPHSDSVLPACVGAHRL